jgi:hypothetical protein
MQVTFDREERYEHSARVKGTDPFFWNLAGPGILGRNYGRLGHGSGDILIES